jgi:hypothetical protein
MRFRLPPGGGVWRFFGGADPSPRGFRNDDDE